MTCTMQGRTPFFPSALPFALLLLWGTCSVSIRVTSVLDSPHPSLFFSLADVPELQRKARTSHHAIADRIVEAVEAMKNDRSMFLPPREHERFTSIWNEEFGNNLCCLAMYCVLFPEDEDALKLAHEFMEIMASHESWEFAKMFSDEMPISHSLVGMATAYDFLYPTLSIGQRKRFFERIRNTTARHFERFKQSSWGKWHLQNHVWNNDVALLMGAVVTSIHDPRADVWAEYVIEHLNISMNLFSLIVDGSNGEGVSYSTLTSRSLTMFLNIIDRHYGIVWYDNYWLEQHFQFLYRTLIGYTETVGIADANPTWFFGPENILVFLDRFVLRSGHGNWLAARIRENRSKEPPWKSILTASVSQRWATYHTEFLWYDEQLGEKDPNPTHRPELVLFSDWGVVTYGGGLPPNHTFFSFKSGYVHGRAVNSAVRLRNAFPENIEGWSSFNPGHEHPDQGSFTFWPRGHPFITETYYGPKFSFFNNVLMFAPSDSRNAKCFSPYEGQIGECFKWLDYKMPELLQVEADIVAAYKEGEFVFTSGESVGVYGKYLNLQSVYRAVILLSPDVLVVVDHIQLERGSKLDRANAFFNMREGVLDLTESVSFPEAILEHSGQKFHIVWTPASNLKTKASTVGYEFPCEFKTRETQILNVSLELQHEKPSRIAYVLFHGSSPRPSHPVFTEETDIGYKLTVSIDTTKYEISVATGHSNVISRLNWLGHTGFATLSSSNGDSVRFGYTSTSGDDNPQSMSSNLPTVFISSMEMTGMEVLVGALSKSHDFTVTSLLYLQKMFKDISIQGEAVDPCIWGAIDLPKAGFPPWLATIFSTPYFTFGEISSNMKEKKSRVAIYSDTGELSSKLSLFPQRDSTKLIYFLRDPRAWVANVLLYGNINSIWKKITSMATQPKCPKDKISPPFEMLHSCIQNGETGGEYLIKLLSLYWSGHVVSALKSEVSSKHLLLVWLEEMVREPETTLEKVFEQFLGVPLPPASRHYLLQYTRSQVLQLASGEVLDHKDPEWWRRVLSKKEIETIESTVAQFSPLSQFL